MRNIVLGGSGLVGSNLSKYLIDNGEEVLIVDREIPQNLNLKKNSFLQVDLVNDKSHAIEWLKEKCKDTNKISVWHLAANSDIRSGISDPFVDYKDTLGTTLTAIEVCKYVGACFLGFSSSSAVYGDNGGTPVNEEMTDLLPISNYGLMKMWSERLILDFLNQESSVQGLIYRFPNVVGLPLTHGLMKDLFEKLSSTPSTIDILGNGRQRKQYIHVEDLVKIILRLREGGFTKMFNIAPKDEGVSVKDIAELARDLISPHTTLCFGNTEYGWKGDVPVYFMDTRKLDNAGMGRELNSQEAIRRILLEIESQLL